MPRAAKIALALPLGIAGLILACELSTLLAIARAYRPR